jgi:uncharacterized protein YcbK (DUF882 family)
MAANFAAMLFAEVRKLESYFDNYRSIPVIACDKREAFAQGSAATRQSIHPLCRAMDCFVARAPRNDGGEALNPQ